MNFEVRSVNRSVLRSMMGERMIRILRIRADFCFSQRRNEKYARCVVASLREIKDRGEGGRI